MTSREWFLTTVTDPWEAYPNFYDSDSDCDTDCDSCESECDDGSCGKCSCSKETPPPFKVQPIRADNVCPDCQKEGEEKGSACICMNKECKRYTIWGC